MWCANASGAPSTRGSPALVSELPLGFSVVVYGQRRGESPIMPIVVSRILVAAAVVLVVTGCADARGGQADYNSQQLSSSGEQIGLGRYLVSSFAVDVAENWQSELLAVGSIAFFAVYLARAGPRSPSRSEHRTKRPPVRAEPRFA